MPGYFGGRYTQNDLAGAAQIGAEADWCVLYGGTLAQLGD